MNESKRHSPELQARQLKLMRDPMSWPQYYLPLKKIVNGGLQAAYLFCEQPVIKHGNIFNPKTEDKAEQFDTYEAILAAGWEVD